MRKYPNDPKAYLGRCTLANREDPDEMLCNATFHQDLLYLKIIKIKTIFLDRNACISLNRNFDWQPLKIQTGQFHTYYINMYGIIHQNEKIKHTTTQLAIKQYTPIKHLKISSQKHKIDSILMPSRCMTNYMKSCSFLQAHFFE